MKKLLAAALLAATAATPASAALFTYTLQNVAFDDGATASGTFGWDGATATITALNVTTSAGALAAYTYSTADLATSNDYSPDWFTANSILFLRADFNRYLNLAFDSSLNTAGVHNLILTGQSLGSWECDNCYTNRDIVSGYVTSDAVTPVDVPEPAMLGLFGLGAIGLGVARRRKV